MYSEHDMFAGRFACSPLDWLRLCAGQPLCFYPTMASTMALTALDCDSWRWLCDQGISIPLDGITRSP